MSCVTTEPKVPGPTKEKTKPADEVETKNGKPCIDFQPGDRWQIKDDDTQNKAENANTSKVKEASCSNGRRSLRSRSNKNSGAVNGGTNDSSSDSEAPVTNTIRAIVHIEEAEKSEKQKIRSKRKLIADIGNGPNHTTKQKKIKIEEFDGNIKIVNNSDPDQEKEDSMKDDTSNSSDSAPPPSESKPTTEKTKLDLDSIEVIEDSKDVSSESSKSQGVEDGLGTKDESQDSEESSESRSKVDKDDDIEVISDGEEQKNSEESDSEIQILGPEDTESKDVSSEFKTSSDLDISLSAGYMYYNSLKEKIPNFKAGEYKPVKFPHTGTLLLAENEVIIESPSLLVPLLIKESDEIPKLEGTENKSVKPSLLQRKNFFQSSVGQFLINLGVSRVQEFYHRDMRRIVQKQLKSAASGHTAEKEKAAGFHEKRHTELKEINAVFNSRMRHCKLCDFKTESAIVLEGHLLTPHLSPRRELKCSFCDFLTRDPSAIVFHFEAMHGKKAVLESSIPLHECTFCSFSSTLRNKINMHINRCRKQFLPSQNLAPAFDFEFPGVTTKPVTMADVVGHRRLLLNSAKTRVIPEDSAYTRKKLASVLSKLSSHPNYMDGKNSNIMQHLISPIVNPLSSGSSIQLPPGIVITRPRGQPIQQIRSLGRGIGGRFPQPNRLAGIRGQLPRRGVQYAASIPSAASHLASSGISITPVSRGAASIRPGTLSGVKNITLTPITTVGNRTVPPQPIALFSGSGIIGQPPAHPLRGKNLLPALRTMSPHQRVNTPPSQVVKGSSGNSFVVCEICDSYIKDLEELRTHMSFMHKVKIHPKMLASRPPLNCQKCQWRFFTDQGLERHLLGAHGLVTTNMQEMANKNQDGGRCIICGAVFTYKLVSHMTQVHKVTLKPAHLSYKCTVCTATFTLYRLFESHVYNEHSGSSKRSADDSSAEPPSKKAAEGSKGKRCNACSIVTDNMQEHLIQKHMKDCYVKLCRIEKCKKCLYSSDEMLVIRMSDFGLDDELDDSSEDSDSSDSEGKEG